MLRFILITFFCLSVFAQEKLETIEVIEVKDSIESAQEINPDAIFFNSKKMVESLSYLPGLDVIDRTAPGVSPELSMRGAPAQNLKILVDDVDYDVALVGNVDLFLWDSWLYESAKISSANTSEAFVFNSGGGSIVLNSPSQPHFKFKTEFGSFDYQKISLSYAKEFNQQFLLLQISLAQALNDFSFVNRNNTPQVASDDFRDRRYNAGYEKGMLKSVYKIKGEKLHHQLSFTKNRVEQALPDINNSRLNRAQLMTDYFIPSYTLQGKNHFKPEFTYFNLRKREHFLDNAGSINLVAQDFTSQYTVHAYNLKSNLLTSDSFHLQGAAHFQDLVYITQDDVANKSENFKRNNSDLILKLRYFTPRFYAETMAGTLYVDDTQKKYSLSNFSQELSYSFNRVWRIAGHFSHGEKLGSLEQLYGNTGFLTGNSNLRSEEIVGKSLSQHFTWDQAKLDVTYFDHDYQDLLVVYFDSRGVGKTQNAERSFARGWELFARYNLNLSWSMFSSITLQEVEYREGSKLGNQLPGRYAEKYSYGVEYNRDSSQFALDLQIFRDIYLDSSNLLKARDYISWNFNYRQSINKDFFASLNLNNLTDEPNQLINGLPAFGRSFILNLEYGRK